MDVPRRVVWIDYTNWRGERMWRRIEPLSLQFANSEWHPETQWLLDAIDFDKSEAREFAMKNIHAWRTEAPNV